VLHSPWERWSRFVSPPWSSHFSMRSQLQIKEMKVGDNKEESW